MKSIINYISEKMVYSSDNLNTNATSDDIISLMNKAKPSYLIVRIPIEAALLIKKAVGYLRNFVGTQKILMS